MTADGKILKLSCLAGLFVGLAALVYGVVLIVGSVGDVDSWATLGEGFAMTGLGAHNARLANVPSNTSKIKTLVLVMLLCTVGVAVFILTRGAESTVVQDVLSVVVPLCLLVAYVYAVRIVKEQLRK